MFIWEHVETQPSRITWFTDQLYSQAQSYECFKIVLKGRWRPACIGCRRTDAGTLVSVGCPHQMVAAPDRHIQSRNLQGRSRHHNLAVNSRGNNCTPQPELPPWTSKSAPTSLNISNTQLMQLFPVTDCIIGFSLTVSVVSLIPMGQSINQLP